MLWFCGVNTPIDTPTTLNSPPTPENVFETKTKKLRQVFASSHIRPLALVDTLCPCKFCA